MKKTGAPHTDWQRIWFSARHREWSSLALVPSDASADVNLVAEMLARTGQLHGERPVSVVKGTGVKLVDVEQVIDSVESLVKRNECALVSVDPLADNPASIAILRACSAAVLIVRLGQSPMAAARTTIEVVGRERFLGSVVLENQLIASE